MIVFIKNQGFDMQTAFYILFQQFNTIFNFRTKIPLRPRKTAIAQSPLPPPPPPPNIVTAIGRFAWRREWTLSLNYYKNSNYKILRRNQQKIKIFFVKFQAPFS